MLNFTRTISPLLYASLFSHPFIEHREPLCAGITVYLGAPFFVCVCVYEYTHTAEVPFETGLQRSIRDNR